MSEQKKDKEERERERESVKRVGNIRTDEKKRGEGRALEVLLKRAKTFSRFFPSSATLVRSAKMYPRNCRLQ